ncbi:Hypothetical predicted protein [Lecanosticta acicola]|uniref:Uncharacterized protein n=1 Tax=Lecanosticta acicola TaxID=111012 RepID=A0AAI8YZ23_9PEZI|nr:Hypothetical predicted protein [Lecanosticta acicola]
MQPKSGAVFSLDGFRATFDYLFQNQSMTRAQAQQVQQLQKKIHQQWNYITRQERATLVRALVSAATRSANAAAKDIQRVMIGTYAFQDGEFRQKPHKDTNYHGSSPRKPKNTLQKEAFAIQQPPHSAGSHGQVDAQGDESDLTGAVIDSVPNSPFQPLTPHAPQKSGASSSAVHNGEDALSHEDCVPREMHEELRQQWIQTTETMAEQLEAINQQNQALEQRDDTINQQNEEIGDLRQALRSYDELKRNMLHMLNGHE